MKGPMSERKQRFPVAVGEALRGYLARSGLGKRLGQAQVIPEWPDLVGPQIAAVASPESVSPDGTLFVRVVTSAWMKDRKSTRLNSSHGYISYAVFCLKKKKTQ